jgi:hypothetical protein
VAQSWKHGTLESIPPLPTAAVHIVCAIGNLAHETCIASFPDARLQVSRGSHETREMVRPMQGGLKHIWNSTLDEVLLSEGRRNSVARKVNSMAAIRGPLPKDDRKTTHLKEECLYRWSVLSLTVVIYSQILFRPDQGLGTPSASGTEVKPTMHP